MGPSERAAGVPLRLLIVEDCADDVKLLGYALRSHGYQVAYTAVDTAEAMRCELERQRWDVITSDHSMPNFNAPAALALARQLCPEVPFIIVSGEIDLKLAVALMKAGAQDYVHKSELIRLGPVVDRELRDAKLKRGRKYAEDKLRESQEIFRAIVENVGDLVAVLDTEGRRIYNSPSYQPLFNAEDIKVGSNSFAEIHPEDRERIKAVFRRTVETGMGERAEFRFVLKDGSIRHIESDGRPSHDAQGKVSKVIVVSRDITERKRMETELLQMATTDFLTGLPNRRHFVARLSEELARMQRFHDERAAVLMLDLDHFKKVNDRFGHATGDQWLKYLATLMLGELRKVDTAGRVGGEEFAIMLPGTSATSAKSFAERLRVKVAETRLELEGQSIQLTVSIGVAALNPKDADAGAALLRADQALYRAKESGRNRVEIAAEAAADR